MRKKLPIFYSAMLLTVVNLLLRLVGTCFQVYLSGRIGAEGIGLLQLVMSVGSLAMVGGMAGIRTATIYLTAEEYGAKRKGGTYWLLSGCSLYSVLSSAAVGGTIYIFAPYLAKNWIGNTETVESIRMFAAFLPVNCLCGVLSGYFTGANRIGTLAAVEVAEQICSMVCTVALLGLWAGNIPERACLSVVLGSGLGACVTLVSLMILRIAEKPEVSPRIPMTNRILQTAVPLALADNLRTGISTLEQIMVPKRLALYPALLSPLAAFGTIYGMVFPLLMFPVAILYGLTELLVPELARCNASGSTKRISYLVQKSLRVTLFYGLTCSGLLYLCADDLCRILFHSELAARYLKVFAPLAVMLYCDAVTDAMIKGLGQQKASVRYNILTNSLDVFLLYFLLPVYGISGYCVSFVITHMLNFYLSIRRLLKISGETLNICTPLLALPSAVFAVWMASLLSVTGVKAAAFLVILFCLLILLQVIRREDYTWVKGLIKRTEAS